MEIEMSTPSEDLVADLAVDYWKLMKAFERVLVQLPIDRARRAEAQLRFASGRLDSNLSAAGLSLAVFDGRPLDATVPASAINADEASDTAIIKETLEPAVLSGSRVLRAARVVLAALPQAERE